MSQDSDTRDTRPFKKPMPLAAGEKIKRPGSIVTAKGAIGLALSLKSKSQPLGNRMYCIARLGRRVSCRSFASPLSLFSFARGSGSFATTRVSK